MPIVFSAVACERNIVANFASCDGNFMEIAEQVMSKLPPCNNKMTYSHGIYLLHYIAEDDYLYFCITDKLCQRSRAFLFLNEIQRRFIVSKLSDDFTTVLAGEMYRYSEDYNTITIRKGELDELNKIGVGCSESLLGEKILHINNPDNISYSTTTHVGAIPSRIYVSMVSQTTEDISHMNAAPDIVSLSIMNPTKEEVSAINSTQTVQNSAQEGSLVVRPTETQISDVSPNANQISITSPSKEIISVVSSTLQQSPNVSLNKEISEVLNPEKMPVVQPRLYIVIIGMIILVMGMAVYTFGPVSCAIVTSIGIYSIFRSYMETKNKSEYPTRKED